MSSSGDISPHHLAQAGSALDTIGPGDDPAVAGAAQISGNLQGLLDASRHEASRWKRELRLGAKNYLLMGSDNGDKAAAVLYGIIASIKANQVEPIAYVRDLLTQSSLNTPPEVATLLPDAWLATHP
ncbi:MAG: transposase domain-containing protein [Planctomycetaceae bacterium]|uniref:Transposase IS66 C-terminal domain-containing protein n=1 Tax=Lacipirellula limnantheis TaxID=2528024 RepID=A0A517TYR4_9BACT|nr:transposase domain-containing protein [Lacipirellula limnantheis]MBL9165513.1 transposase domain-containing protein [Planctomycetaceae bacterium]QDT73517.1 hypothetical protein I41_27060 [Lacipirellula limnantheis]